MKIQDLIREQAKQPAISRRMIGYLRTLRQHVRRDACYDPGTAGCSQSTEFLEARFGWPRMCGTYLSKTLEPLGDHCWNFLADGSIIDITADQFKEPGYGGIKIVRPNNPEYYRYRTEYGVDYYPGGQHPDPAVEEPLPSDPMFTGKYDPEMSNLASAARSKYWWTKKKYMRNKIPNDWQERIQNDPFRHWGNPKIFSKMWSEAQESMQRFKHEHAEWDEEILKKKTLENVKGA